ncbi:MAG: aldehyde dehydrogenase family protein [Streptosporangiales bacterium]|nr:aldehyde dehydrogenase family protein [Streptosporangiales bacterium]
MTTTAPAGSAGLDVAALLTDGAHLVGGEWVPAKSGETIDVINPATQDLLLRVPRGRADDVDAAVRAAAEAFPAWRDTSPAVRGDLLYRWARLCEQHATDLDRLESMEVGRPSWGPSPVSRMLTYTAGLVDKITGLTLPTANPNVLGMAIREPYGVCGSIIPWNTPAPLTAIDVGPAIGAGNTVVVKPAEDAPLSCLYLAALALEAGIPPGVINVVTGYGPEAGAALPSHPLVRHMSFTGSPEIPNGRDLAEIQIRGFEFLQDHGQMDGKDRTHG